MPRVPLQFSVNQLVINESDRFEIDTFSEIQDTDVETIEIVAEEATEILGVKRISKQIEEDRFVLIYFEMGDKYPYPDKVMSSDLEEHDNPRSPDEIELDKQIFALVDIQTQQLYLGGASKKKDVRIWLENKLNLPITLKSIIREDQFLQRLSSVNEVSFALAPDLLNSGTQDTLSNNLARDIFGFGAQRAEIKLSYSRTPVVGAVKDKIASLLARRDQFQKVVVIGRSDDNLESVLNLEGISTRIVVDIEDSIGKGMLNHNLVFGTLIQKIKEHENS